MTGPRVSFCFVLEEITLSCPRYNAASQNAFLVLIQ